MTTQPPNRHGDGRESENGYVDNPDGHPVDNPVVGDRGSAAAGSPTAAAHRAVNRHSVQTRLPVIGNVRLPSSSELAFVAGLGTLAAVGILEWPVAAVLAVGHSLAAGHRNRALREFGEALDKA